MTDEELTRGELLDRLEGFRRRISDLERTETERRQAEKTRTDALAGEKKKLDEELQLRYAQLKASEEELKSTRKLHKENDSKLRELQSQFAHNEKRLRESESHYRHLVANIPGMLAVQDVQAKKYVFWNREIGWSGYTLDEWNKLSHDAKRKLIHPDDLPRYLKLWKEWEQAIGDKPLAIQYRLRHKDGSYKWIELNIFKERSEDHSVIAQVEISWDTTERKEAEEALKAREAMERLISDSQIELCYKLDAEGNYQYVNHAFCRTFGKRESDLIGKKFAPAVHQDEFEATREAMRKLELEPHRAEVEHRTLTQNGWRWFRWSLRALPDGAGRVESVIASGIDISERKRLEAEMARISSDVNARVENRNAELIETNARMVKQLEQRKQTEAELLESRANLQRLIEPLKGFIFELDSSGNIKHVNPTVLEKLGQTEDVVLHTLESTIRTGEEQRKARSNLQMLLGAIEDFVFVLDSKGRILFANSSAAERLEYPEQDLVGMNIMVLHPPNRRDEASATLADAIQGKTKSYTIPFITRDKTLIPAETRLILGRWDNHNAIIAVTRDVADRKISERKLVESEKRYRLLVEEAVVGACILQEGIVRMVTPQFAATVGYPTDEIMGWNTNDLEVIVHPDDREAYLKQRRKNRTRARAETTEYSFRCQTGEGKIRWLEMFAKPITIENAPAEMFSLVDITEFKCADEVQLKNELARISKSKSEAVELFAESVAHGFNELLTVITGHSQMGLMAIHEGDPIRKDFEEIDRAAELGSKLTWKLLTYAGRHSWDPVPLNLEDRIQAMEKVLKRILGNKIELEISSADTLRRVKLDPDLLEQVMLNLTLNAREAIPESGKVLIQLVSTDVGTDDASHPGIPAGSYVTLSYRDNGPGIPMDIRDRIFDPFFTTKSDRKGAGLGLATVYGVVRKSGGFIGVDSEPGKGTTFRLYFPAVAGEEEPIVEPDRVVAPTREETIMVVDDDDAVREMASQILRWHGFKVIEARSGREALQMCKKLDKPVDAVVSDVVMPNMGGIELMENLRKLWGCVSVLYISGATADKTLDPNIPLLRKPFHPKELVKRVKEILGGQ